MCEKCGCSDGSQPTLVDLANGETVTIAAVHEPNAHAHHEHGRHEHGHDHHHHDDHHHDDHHHDHSHGHSGTLRLEHDILAKNNQLAERNRGWLAGRNLLAFNLVSSPGAGKTTLLERTIRAMGEECSIQVIEGDQATLNDAERIKAAGCRVVQINTGAICHLDAAMVARGLEQLDPPTGSLVMIENVGNLVCPSLFDLGERAKVVTLSAECSFLHSPVRTGFAVGQCIRAPSRVTGRTIVGDTAVVTT